jgi:hypothetical protein
MNQLFETPTDYPADFEEARKAYGPGKNDSKSDAFKAWNQTAKIRMSAGAFGHRLLECFALYNEFLAGENVKRSRSRQSDYPKAHMATWLRQRRWEGYMVDAEARFARATTEATKEKVVFDGWEKEAAGLIQELTDARFTAWFANVQVTRGEPTELMFPNSFKASYVAKSFSYALRRAFGSCRLTAAGSEEKFDI